MGPFDPILTNTFPPLRFNFFVSYLSFVVVIALQSVVVHVVVFANYAQYSVTGPEFAY